MKIGIIGSGKIGGTLGLHLANADYEVLFSSRHPEQLKSLADKAGDNGSTGNVKEAAEFGKLVILAVPFRAIPEIAEYSKLMERKIMVDATNPFPNRDGEMATRQKESGKTSSRFVADYFPGSHVLKAFNTIFYRHLQDQVFRKEERRAIPYAGDHQPSLDKLRQLIDDIGFGPVYVGKLSESRIMEPGQPLFTNDLSVKELQQVLDNDS